MIEGEAGIGKSRLLEETTLGVDGIRVLRGKASELERQRPFGPLLDALGLRTHELAETLPNPAAEATTSFDFAHQFAVADRLLDLFERASADGPVALVVEDIHWADSATLSLVARLARQRGPLNTSLLCTRRPSPHSTNLEALLKSFTDDGGVEMRLSPLPDSAVDEIVAELAGARPSAALSARVRGASGNPLYVIEFVEGMSDELTHKDGVAEVSDATAPPSLSLTIIRRLGFLPAETIELVRTAAILGAAFGLDELTAVAHQPALELMPLLQPAIDANVVIPTNEGFRFRHDLIHEATYADIPAPVRRVLHAAAAAALAAEPTADVTHVARHFELGTDGPDAAASDWLWKAAVATSRLDRNTSFEWMALSVAATPQDHLSLLDRRVSEATYEAFLPGSQRVARARAMLCEPLPSLHRWVLEEAVVTGLALAGDIDAAEQLAFATPRPRAAQMAMGAALVGARCLVGDPDGADRLIADLLASVGGDDEDEAQLLHRWVGDRDDSQIVDFWLSICRGLVAWTRGENESGPAIARRWEELVSQLVAPPQALEGVALILASDSSEHGWRASLRRIGAFASHAVAEIDAGAGFAYWIAGEWDEALTQFETACGRVETNDPRLSDSLLALAALIEAERGHDDIARAWLHRSQAIQSQAGLGTWVEAVLAEAAGDLESAQRLLAEAWRRDEQSGVRVWQRLYAADLVRHAVRSGDNRLAHEVVSVVESLLPRGGDIALAVAKHCRGLIDNKGAGLIEAADLFRQIPRPVQAARADEDGAVAFASSDPTKAQELFGRATAVYEALGAKRDLTRLARRQRETGSPRKTPPAPRPLTGWGSLTKSELKVAELVSHGLTYRAIGERLFVSRRTVETHVAHVFGKLDVRSKSELASAYVARFGA